MILQLLDDDRVVEELHAQKARPSDILRHSDVAYLGQTLPKHLNFDHPGKVFIRGIMHLRDFDQSFTGSKSNMDLLALPAKVRVPSYRKTFLTEQ